MSLLWRLRRGIRRRVKRALGLEPPERTWAPVVERPYAAPSAAVPAAPPAAATTAPPAAATTAPPAAQAAEPGAALGPSSREPGAPDAHLSEAERSDVRARAIAAIQTVFDPEIPVNIYELGLVYRVDVAENGVVDVEMTLTSPNCPAAQSIPSEVEARTRAVDGATGSNVNVVWEPAWNPSMMSEAAQLELNMV